MTRLIKITLIMLLCIEMVNGQADTNLLAYKDSTYYKESSIIQTYKSHSKNELILYQEVCYNEPVIIDEEYCYTLKLIFLDKENIKLDLVLNLANDTSIIKCEYGVLSGWSLNYDNNIQISGQIEIIEWGKKRITIKENIIVYDKRKNTKRVFVGTRTFTRQKRKYLR